MLRYAVLVLAAIALVAIAASTVSASPFNGHGQRPTTVAVVERAVTDAVVDLGEPGDSIGDLLTFGNPIYDAANASQIGTDQGECFRTNPGASWECTWTTYLADGSLTVQGPFLDSLGDSTLAITGGTGIYRAARGEMTLHARDAAGTSFDFVYHVLH
jgi:allene oxide cyclase